MNETPIGVNNVINDIMVGCAGSITKRMHNNTTRNIRK